MGLWQGILIVLGCLVAGLMVGLLLIRLFRPKKGKEYSLLNKEANFIKTPGPEVSVAATFSHGMTKSNGHEDPLEVLLKNHKNSIAAEKATQSDVTGIPGGVEIAGQKNAPVIEKEEKPTDVMHWTELYSSSNQRPLEPPVTKEPVVVNQKSTLLEGEPNKTTTPGILRESEIISDKTAPADEKHKKVFKSSVPKKSETVIREGTPVVKDKKTDTKPLVQELTENEQKITPVVVKPESTLKSELIIEMESNLEIASQPWADKLIPFQTKCWDSKHGETDLFLNTDYQELIQLYVDIGLANNIVWLATEINHRSKELDESYTRLCSSIVVNIKKILL